MHYLLLFRLGGAVKEAEEECYIRGTLGTLY